MRHLALAAAVSACSAGERPPAKPTPSKTALTAPGLRLPDGVTPLAYNLRLEIDPDREDFHGHVDIRVRFDRPSDHVWIHADELDITGGLAQLPYQGDQMRAFALPRTTTGETTLSFDYTGHTRHDQEGVFRQTEDGHTYAFTQGESVFARRIVPCFDEPKWKTPWQLTLVVPHGDVALANTKQASERALPDGRREVTFAPTPPMASYLLAFAVGPFELVDAGTAGKNHVPLRVAALAGQRERVAVARQNLPEIIETAELLLEEPLPLAKLDFVVVPKLFGAMENPGLITFEESALVGDAASTSFRRHFIRMAAHEIVHQWFGDLVTPAWWDDLWLAEAFASWLGDRITAKMGALGDADLDYAHQRRDALDADAEPDAQPIRRRIEHNEDPDNGFDTIAYAKGAVVLEMFDASIRAWDRGVHTYLAAHRNGIATTKDLVASFDNEELGAALLDAIDHTGVPVVELALRCEPKPTVTAKVRAGRIVPVCLRYGDAQRSMIYGCKLVRGEASFDVSLPGCPTWVSGNRVAGYYEVAGALPLPPPGELNPREVLALGDDLAAALDRGELAPTDAIAAITKLAAGTDLYSQLGAAAIARTLDPLFSDAQRPQWAKFLAARFATALSPRALAGARSAAELELRDELAMLVPPSALPADTARAAARALDATMSYPGGVPDPALAAFAAPVAGRATFEHIEQIARTTRDPGARAQAVEALGKFDLGQLDRAIAFYLDAPDVTAEQAWPAVAGYLERADTRIAAWRAIRAQMPKLVARATADEGPALVASAASLCEPTSHAEVAGAFEPHVRSISDGRRHLDKVLAAIDHCVTRRAHAGDLTRILP